MHPFISLKLKDGNSFLSIDVNKKNSKQFLLTGEGGLDKGFELAAKFLADHLIEHNCNRFSFLCSSSIDFPEEYGLSEDLDAVQLLYNKMEAHLIMVPLDHPSF